MNDLTFFLNLLADLDCIEEKFENAKAELDAILSELWDMK